MFSSCSPSYLTSCLVGTLASVAQQERGVTCPRPSDIVGPRFRFLKSPCMPRKVFNPSVQRAGRTPRLGLLRALSNPPLPVLLTLPSKATFAARRVPSGRKTSRPAPSPSTQAFPPSSPRYSALQFTRRSGRSCPRLHLRQSAFICGPIPRHGVHPRPTPPPTPTIYQKTKQKPCTPPHSVVNFDPSQPRPGTAAAACHRGSPHVRHRNRLQPRPRAPQARRPPSPRA